jgi:hypothetical protein
MHVQTERDCTTANTQNIIETIATVTAVLPNVANEKKVEGSDNNPS